jgi:transcriptional regulator with XRE-family HTH domain
MSLGGRILAARRAKGWSQARLGERAGVAPTTISKWETGKSEPSTVERIRLAEALNIPASSLGVLAESSQSRSISVMGYVGPGSAIQPLGTSDGIQIIDPPVGIPDSAECVLVHGDALMPLLPAGAAIVYWRWAVDPTPFLGRLCIVELQSGEMVARIIERGSQRGLWTLTSLNAAPIRDVAIKRAAPADYYIPDPAAVLTFSGIVEK